MRELVLRALLGERLPEWRKASIERIKQGQTNNAFLLTLGKRRALCKIDTQPRAGVVNSRVEEAAIQRRVAASGLSPAVLYADEHCIVTEYVDADVLNAEDLLSRDVLGRLGVRLAALHDLPLTGRRFDAAAAGNVYAATIADTETAEHCLEMIDGMSDDDDLVFSHNDLVAGNILRTDRILFIDWEYACDNSPLFDVATIVAHHALDVDSARTLLEARFDDSSSALMARLMTHVRGYRALYWLWLANRNPDDRLLDTLKQLLDNA